MGVHALWNVVGPTAKPVRLESLSDKRLAVDASIWIYQFLKAVRDKEGNAMRYSHVVGFFRRICKLLYFGIKPVFVFDGGAPALKRRTIQQRKERRQGRRDNAASTARKLLALQMQNSKTVAPRSNSNAPSTPSAAASAEPYMFKPNDEYDLPQIPGFKYEKNDTRVNSDEDFRTVLENLDELDGIDLDSINPASKEFDELPKSTQYMILSALRLKSRLRMGYSKEQLETIFPNSMDFSKFQIDMVKRRNFFTQKLMNITNLHDGGASKIDEESIRRVEGQRGKQYQLIKTDNGWTLSLDGNDGSEVKKAIVLDDPQNSHNSEKIRSRDIDRDDDDDDDDDDYDDNDEIEWEEVELEDESKRKDTDYSIKASLLPQLGETSQAGGGQSFLDKRYELAASDSVRQKVRYVADTSIQNEDNDDDDSDDFAEYAKEVNMMEDVQKSRVAKNNTIEAAVANVAETNLDNSTSQCNPSKDYSFNSVHEETKISADTEQHAMATSNSITSEGNSPPLKYSTSSLFKAPENSEDTMPTESEQNLQDIVDKIPDFNFTGDSLLFKSSEPKENTTSRIAGVEEEPKNHQETPEWFKTTTTPNYNPYSMKSFTANSVDKNNNHVQTEDERIGLISGANAQEFIDNRLELTKNLYQGASDEDEIIEIIPDMEKSTKENEEEIRPQLSEQQPHPVHNISDKSNGGAPLEDNNEQSSREKDNAQIPVVDYDFSEDEEDALVEQLRQEEQEYDSFKTSLNPHIASTAFLEEELTHKQMKEKRDSDEVTAAMVTEVQDLLSRFGIPFVTAPMEAEAQCAELFSLKLVDGIITDDSDIFLFGGDKVYKNMFHEKNYVEFYQSDILWKDLGLDREKFIELAQLLGSDYTNGVKGVGPVSAMEILAEFGNLAAFRDWYSKGQFNKKLQKQETTFQKNLRKRLVTNEVILDSDFPSEIVREAYIRPEVDHDTTKFVWGVPDLDMLRMYLRLTIGWPQEKADEVLIPLIKEINNRKKTGTQKTLTSFFPTEYIKASKDLKISKRIKDASGKLKKQRTK